PDRGPRQLPSTCRKPPTVKYCILGDIHANLEALQTVVEYAESQGCEKYVSVGDVVGYGANPGDCLNLVRELGAPIVAGNHDYAVTGKLDVEFFNSYAKAAVLWTRAQLTDEQMGHLKSLRLVHQVEDVMTIVHGSLNFPDMFDYIQTSYDAYLSLEALKTPVCFLGHSHVPVSFFSGPAVSYSLSSDIELEGYEKVLINVGSVGQPRDENPRAACAIYDTEAKKVSLTRLEYDIEKAARKIIDAGLPDILAERLHHGR
ncbi:MAG: metallophosphoesterase, partial [Planctomycetota bacterium]